MNICNRLINKTKYFRLRLYDAVSSRASRAETDLRLTQTALR